MWGKKIVKLHPSYWNRISPHRIRLLIESRGCWGYVVSLSCNKHRYKYRNYIMFWVPLPIFSLYRFVLNAFSWTILKKISYLPQFVHFKYIIYFLAEEFSFMMCFHYLLLWIWLCLLSWFHYSCFFSPFLYMTLKLTWNVNV